MNITSLNPVVNQPRTINPQPSQTTDVSFANLLADASSSPPAKADVISGRIGIDYKEKGFISSVSYFDDQGNLLARGNFNAQDILEKTQQFGIPLTDLRGAGQQLDEAGVGYKPYELYPGTGSDHGIDFEDLISGGLGTAYDWRVDANVALKGPFAQRELQKSQALAEQLGLKLNPLVTTGGGIDPARLATQKGVDGVVRNFVLHSGGTASWYQSSEEAAKAQSSLGGRVYDKSQQSAAGAAVTRQPANTQQASIDSSKSAADHELAKLSEKLHNLTEELDASRGSTNINQSQHYTIYNQLLDILNKVQ
ncbi:hypothetical protein [Candidatus Methylobacter oryzae]|uniref:Uncharacterized protein n=1 Tax=Candidatus Methylobacter oryzae TaxID=2497749 RepID=A0ABY3C7I1_9GAMM|nr:hypothetical protein [Candidatus Methylobacter oryzae]TRW92016.1 hypothetical protein EKO24_016155 [Candidatus Methylobacter oryzae]